MASRKVEAVLQSSRAFPVKATYCDHVAVDRITFDVPTTIAQELVDALCKGNPVKNPMRWKVDWVFVFHPENRHPVTVAAYCIEGGRKLAFSLDRQYFILPQPPVCLDSLKRIAEETHESETGGR